MIEFQEAAEAPASLDVPCPFTDPILGRWKQDHVALAWVISLRVEMIHVVFKAVAERAFSEKNYFHFFDRLRRRCAPHQRSALRSVELHGNEFAVREFAIVDPDGNLLRIGQAR